MSTLNTWVVRARGDCSVDTVQYPDTRALEDANVVIHMIEDHITSDIGEGFFWDILAVDDTVIGQNEYTFPVISTGLFNGAQKVESISIKYRDNYDFIKATEVNRETLEHDLNWYESNQPESSPIYFIADNSVFIFPSTKVVIEGGIKFYGIKSLADVTLSTTDADLFGGKIPKKYYYIISEGLKQFIKRYQGKDNEGDIAQNRFDQIVLPQLTDRLGNRKVGISVRQPANVSKYK